MPNRGIDGVRASGTSGRFGVTENFFDRLGPAFTPITATGGTVSDVTISGRAYRLHTFTSVGSSTFTVTDAGTDKTVEYLIVGGGGSGARGQSGASYGGGGAGGGVQRDSIVVAPGSYTVVVGAGTSVQNSFGAGLNGTASSFDAITADAGLGATNGVASSQYAVVRTSRPNLFGGGSGGGGFENAASTGGRGFQTNITGTTTALGGGGGGHNGSGFDGGGSGSGGSATANTGGGGGGGSPAGSVAGGAGGSGIVILRYPLEAA